MQSNSIVRATGLPFLALVLSAVLATPALANPEASRKTVNVNQASVTELSKLPRVGEKLAERIVEHRTKNGPFKRAEDLMEVKGIGEKMFALLKPYVATAGPTTLTEKVSSANSKKSGKAKSQDSPAAKPEKSAS
jgi:competence protein ComEA